MRHVDISGQRFGGLLVQSRAEKRGQEFYWRCVCDCGQIKLVGGSNLKCGRINSCGCRQIEKTIQRSTTHGATAGGIKTREYRTWSSAKRRCFDSRRDNFKYYGGRGITMCDRWRDSFEAFLADMGPCPNGCTLDRKDNDGNYDPDNCRWATATVQTNNTRKNVRFLHGSQLQTTAEIARFHNVGYHTLYKRLAAGQNVEEAVASIRWHRVHGNQVRPPSTNNVP